MDTSPCEDRLEIGCSLGEKATSVTPIPVGPRVQDFSTRPRKNSHRSLIKRRIENDYIGPCCTHFNMKNAESAHETKCMARMNTFYNGCDKMLPKQSRLRGNDVIQMQISHPLDASQSFNRNVHMSGTNSIHQPDITLRNGGGSAVIINHVTHNLVLSTSQ